MIGPDFLVGEKLKRSPMLVRNLPKIQSKIEISEKLFDKDAKAIDSKLSEVFTTSMIMINKGET